jgi:FkbH-like protein
MKPSTTTNAQQKDTDPRKIKCVVWDLDHTLWKGVLLEDKDVTLKQDVAEIIKTLDSRGILNSIASKNNHDQAMDQLKKFCMDQYFIYPQICWDSKVVSIKKIAELINIGKDTLAFIDDQEFERDEVNYSIPEVLCVDSYDLSHLLDMPEMNPRFITDESKIRRKMYQADILRNKTEEKYEGPQEDFLRTLKMIFRISPASVDDLKRAEELTVRTNQLNTTGYTYSYDELDFFLKSDKHILLVADLEDRYGPYGKIGLCLIEKNDDIWFIKLLLMSCRVMSRGVGTVLINYIRQLAKDSSVRLLAEMIPTDVNRMMYMTYKFNHFREIDQKGELVIFENDLTDIPEIPDYLTMKTGRI